MKKTQVNNNEVTNSTLEVIRQMNMDGFKPDVVCGFARGGLVPANFISQWYDIPMYAINKDEDCKLEFLKYSNVLIIDDINDTGKTFSAFKCLYDVEFSFKYAALIENAGSEFETDYAGNHVNKVEDPSWIVFPWENWWRT